MDKAIPLNRNIVLGLFLVFVYLFFVAYMRFTHQDVGWYYAYADRLAGRFSLNHANSTWSFADANGDNGAGGVIFILLQFISILLCSNDLLAVKILAALIAFSTYMAFLYLLKNKAGVRHYFAFSLLLLVDPLFPFQVMNRPEMLGCFVGLIIFNIGLSKKTSPWKFFWISFLTFLLLDIHPISVYLVAGFNLLIFFKNYRKILYFAGGALASIGLITGLNYMLTGTLGIFAFFGDTTQYMNDHYFPLFTDPFSVIISRPFIKLKYFVVYLLFGILLYYLIRYFKDLKQAIFSKEEYRLLFLNGIIFFLLSNLFSEGGNGYNLYSLIIYLPLFIIIYNEIIKKLSGKALKIFIAFLLIVPAVGLYKSVPRFYQWVQNNRYFLAHYNDINEKIKDGDRILLRPSFSFALSSRKVFCEPTYPVLMNMYNYKRDFPHTLLAKNLDVVSLDEMFLRDADIKSKIDKYSNGVFYKAVQQVKFDTSIIADMSQKGVLNPVMEYNDFYHGHTVFYRVNKELLKQYCEPSLIVK